MITILGPEKRGRADFGWLKTSYLFSFADYYDPSNVEWGEIRVFNDDRVAPQAGFPPHPHSEMEIVTIVLEGAITHEDSMGHREKVIAGEVQSMSAGEGLEHSEYNAEGVPLHLYQIWIRPGKAGLKPSYGQKKFKPSDWEGKLLAVASGQGKTGATKISTDSTIYRCSLAKGKAVEHKTEKGRHILIYVADGSLAVNGREIGKECQARITGEEKIAVESTAPSSFILIDAP